MLFDLCVWQFAGNPLASPVGLKNRDADWAGHAAGICVNDVFDGPCCEEYGLAHIRLTVLAENVDEESEEWIGGELPRSYGNIIMMRIK